MMTTNTRKEKLFNQTRSFRRLYGHDGILINLPL
jgi:hypothetical protein